MTGRVKLLSEIAGIMGWQLVTTKTLRVLPQPETLLFLALIAVSDLDIFLSLHRGWIEWSQLHGHTHGRSSS